MCVCVLKDQGNDKHKIQDSYEGEPGGCPNGGVGKIEGKRKVKIKFSVML